MGRLASPPRRRSILYEKSFNLKTISQGDFGHFRENNLIVLSKVAKIALKIVFKLKLFPYKIHLIPMEPVAVPGDDANGPCPPRCPTVPAPRVVPLTPARRAQRRTSLRSTCGGAARSRSRSFLPARCPASLRRPPAARFRWTTSSFPPGCWSRCRELEPFLSHPSQGHGLENSGVTVPCRKGYSPV